MTSHEPKTIKVCLVSPCTGTYPPINLAYLASYLNKYGKHRYQIKIVDKNYSPNLLEEITDFAPDVLGISVLTPLLLDAIEISDKISKWNSKIFQIVGGPHPTISPEELLKNSKVHVAVIGEGEQTFLELVDAYAENSHIPESNSLKEINGICFKVRSDSELQYTLARKVIADLDTIPFPAWELINMKYYLNRYFLQRGIGGTHLSTIVGARGCPYRCIFCCVNFSAQGKVRFHSNEYIIEQIKQMIDKFGVKQLYFTDDIFFLNKNKIFNLCQQLIKNNLHRKIKWEVNGRTNLIKEQDYELLQIMRSANCEQIDWGLESGNQRVLTLIKGKGITLEDHRRAILITKKAGIKNMGTFILATPTETYDEMLDTKKFIKDNLNLLDRFMVGCMRPYPGTRVYEMLREEGIIGGDSFEEVKKIIREERVHFRKVYSNTVTEEQVFSILKELDVLSIKKIPLNEKLKWSLHNLVYNKNNLVLGIKWIKDRVR